MHLSAVMTNKVPHSVRRSLTGQDGTNITKASWDPRVANSTWTKTLRGSISGLENGTGRNINSLVADECGSPILSSTGLNKTAANPCEKAIVTLYLSTLHLLADVSAVLFLIAISFFRAYSTYQ